MLASEHRSVKEQVMDQGARLHSTGDDPEPRRGCPLHPTNENGDDPCQRCKQARLNHEAWQQRRKQRAADAGRIAAQRKADCPQCDEEGWLLGPDGAPGDFADRCTHDAPSDPPTSASDAPTDDAARSAVRDKILAKLADRPHALRLDLFDNNTYLDGIKLRSLVTAVRNQLLADGVIQRNPNGKYTLSNHQNIP